MRTFAVIILCLMASITAYAGIISPAVKGGISYNWVDDSLQTWAYVGAGLSISPPLMPVGFYGDAGLSFKGKDQDIRLIAGIHLRTIPMFKIGVGGGLHSLKLADTTSTAIALNGDAIFAPPIIPVFVELDIDYVFRATHKLQLLLLAGYRF